MNATHRTNKITVTLAIVLSAVLAVESLVMLQQDSDSGHVSLTDTNVVGPARLVFEYDTYYLVPTEYVLADGTPTFVYQAFDANTGEAVSWDDIDLMGKGN